MSPTARLPEPEGEQTVDGTLRLRGGCIPCPVRLPSSLSVSTYLPMSTSTSPFYQKTCPYPSPFLRLCNNFSLVQDAR